MALANHKKLFGADPEVLFLAKEIDKLTARVATLETKVAALEEAE